MTILINYFLLKLHMHTMHVNTLHVVNEQTVHSVTESFSKFTSIILLQNPSSHQLKTMIQMYCCFILFLSFCAMFCTSLFIFLSSGHCVVCPSSIYNFWLPHYYLQPFLQIYCICFHNLVYENNIKWTKNGCAYK